MIKNSLLLALLGIAVAVPAKLCAESKTATVSPGSHEVVKFAGDESGIYQLNIQAGSGHTIKDSDFTATFKADTLWQRNSKTSYKITYTDQPKPPGVSVEGDFEQNRGGGGEGYSPNDFLVDVPNVDCEPQDTELKVEFYSSGGFESLTLYSAVMKIWALWNEPESCTCHVGICQNVIVNSSVAFTDGSSLGISTTSYLLDGPYPTWATISGTNGTKKTLLASDYPAMEVSIKEAIDVKKMTDTTTAEDFFMVIPQQGPPLSKMIVSWWVSGTVERNGSLALTYSDSSPNSGAISGSNNTRAPIATGITANEYGRKYWKKTSGGSGSMADTYISKHNHNP